MTAPDDRSPRYWLLIGNVPVGPLTPAQVHAKLAAAEVDWNTSACLIGGGWQPLLQTPGIGPPRAAAVVTLAACTAAALTPSLPPRPPPLPEAAQSRQQRRPRESGGGWRAAGGWVLVVVLVAILARSCSSRKQDNKKVPTVVGPPAGSYSPRPTPPPIAVARLHVRGRDGTAELHQLVAGMTESERLALGLGVVLTGVDTYGARVRITNTGTVPVRVYPENILIHFGAESTVATTVNHPWFFQRGVLQPGYYFEGLVMYQARIDVGVSMRLGGGGLSYSDPTVEVTYDP